MARSLTREAPYITALFRAITLLVNVILVSNVDKPLKSLIAQNSFTNTVWLNDQKS